jgi:hypothetical protein
VRDDDGVALLFQAPDLVMQHLELADFVFRVFVGGDAAELFIKR